MDKRTLFFVIALSLALFGVNLYFEQGRQETLKTWNEQQKANKLQLIENLEKEISEHAVSTDALPIVSLFADKEGKQFLTTGVFTNESILTFSWSRELPQTIYARDAKNPQMQEYHLRFLPDNTDELILYQKEGAASLLSGDLPEFGTYHLQLFTPSTNGKLTTPNLGISTNGHFTWLQQQLHQLKQATNSASLPGLEPIDAIVLIKNETGYLPIGIYQSQQNQFTPLEEIAGLNSIVKKSTNKGTTSSSKSTEKFYLLETPYQQLVFSNYGGALAEINLPFQSPEHPNSVVKEIDFDRQLVERHPYNAYFPAHPFYRPGDETEHAKGQLGGYYPLIRRDLIESRQRESIKLSPRYYSLNIVSEYPEVAELVYEVKQFDQNSITFESRQPHRRITKTYTLGSKDAQAPYTLNLSIKIEGDSRGLWLTTGVPEVEWISAASTPTLKYRITRNNKSYVENVDLPSDTFTTTSAYPDWICNSNGFLGLIVDPISKVDPGYRAEYVAGTTVPSRLIEIESEHGRFKAQDLPGYSMLLPLKTTGGTIDFRVFAGPFSDSVLKQVDAIYADTKTGYNPDYIACQTFHGWFSFISEPFAKFLFILMKLFYSLTGSWAFSIILLTIALRVMMYPLNAWSAKSMVKMQQIGPEVAAIQEKYKKEPKQAQIEVMNLYREKGVNPVSGCLPMLIQMPFLIGMFDLLKSTFELRGASFIPGWIDDLSTPDVLFSWNTPLFFIGNQFHLLPFLLGGVMFIQQRFMSAAPIDPSLMTDQQRQQKAMGTIMSVLFTFMFYNFPSGLNIYWLSSMLLGMLQQWWTARGMQVPAVASTVEAKSAKKR